MRILIPCFESRGHHLHFARLLCRAAEEIGCRPVLALPAGASQGAEFRTWFGDRPGTEVVEPFGDHRPGSLLGAMRQARLVRGVLQQFRCDHAWIHWADGVAVGRLVAGIRDWGVPTEALFLRGRYAYPGAVSLRDRMAAAVAKAAIGAGEWESRWHLDPLCADFLRTRSLPVKRMPEPVEPMRDIARDASRLRLGLPSSGTILGVLGSLDRRKGVIELLRAFARSGVRDLRLALLGKLDPDVAESVHGLASRCPLGSVFIRDAVLTPDEFADALAACDWHSVAYPRHFGSSGILVRAASIDRPVLASDFGWVGEATRRYGLGVTCDASSVDAIADRLRMIQERPEFAFGPLRDSFVRFNTEANFIAHWTAVVRTRLGLPSDQALFEFQ